MPTEPMLPATNEITLDEDNLVLIVVPTVADPDVLVPTIVSLATRLPYSTRVVLAVNSDRPELAKKAVEQCQNVKLPNGDPMNLDVYWDDGLVGFGNAINHGIMHAAQTGGLPPYTIVFNDDLRVTEGWMQGLIAAAEADYIHLLSEPAQPIRSTMNIDTDDDALVHPPRDRNLYGRVGMVGPVTDCAAGVQQVVHDQGSRKAMISSVDGYEQFAAGWRAANEGKIFSTSFLSGYCMMFTRDCLVDLFLKDASGENYTGPFDGDQYPVAGFEDNDICLRAELLGWRQAVAYDTFIGHLGHQTFDRAFPEELRGMRNRLQYLRRWRDFNNHEEPLKLVGMYRARIGNVNDLHVFRQSVLRHSSVLDGFAVMLTNNPLDMQDGNDWEMLKPSLRPEDLEMLQACSEASQQEVTAALQTWLTRLVEQNPGGCCGDIQVDAWTGSFNERDERNAGIALAESMDADWIISIDTDEFLEDRVTRRLLDRIMLHPDPMVDSVDVGWLNHWDSTRSVRIDRPWGDDGTHTGGMRGPRLWRVCKAAPKRIQAGNYLGLHCGNAPESNNFSRVISGIRFRHFGYTRDMDRATKYARYMQIDPTPDLNMVGPNGYTHIVDDEGMRLRPYVSSNGIGFFMLCHAGEDIGQLMNWLHQTYALVDRQMLVWTDAWNDDDKSWTEMSGAKIEAITEWPATGPSQELAEFCAYYGVQWVHKELDDNLAEARNAGIDAMREHHKEGVGWAWFMDPDEWVNWGEAAYAIRSMAEISDSWGWMLKFRNIHNDGEDFSYSERVSLCRLDKEGRMRMNGRVHEGFDKSLAAIQESGIHPRLRYAPFESIHLGLNKTPEQIQKKLQYYTGLLLKQLEEDPLSPGSWTSLGLQLVNEGQVEKAIECYERGILCAGNSYLPYKELGLVYLRLARQLFEQVRDLTIEEHKFHQYAVEIVESVSRFAPEQAIIGMPHPDGETNSFELPHFPFEMMVQNEVLEVEAPVVEVECTNGKTTHADNGNVHAGNGNRVQEPQIQG